MKAVTPRVRFRSERSALSLGCRASRAAIVAGLVLLQLIAGSAASFADEYDDALAAIEGRRWTDATVLLKKAIAERPKSRAGGLRRQYLPHYYLGVAHHELGECAAAEDAWRTALEQAAVRETADLLADLEKRRADCRSRQQQAAELAAEIGEARKLLGGVVSLGESMPDAWESGGESTPRERSEQAAAALDAAEAITGRSVLPTQEATAEARRSVSAAAASLSAIKDEIRAVESAEQSRVADAGNALEAALSRARRALSEAEKVETPDASLASGITALRRAVMEARSALDGEDTARMETVRRSLDALAREIQRAPRIELSEQLVEGAGAFFAGDYDRAREILEAYADTEEADAALLYAATCYALHVLDGETDPLLIDEARDAIRRSREIEPDLEPSTEFFSPRFVEFFATAVAGPEADG